jgi:hypothetical protein
MRRLVEVACFGCGFLGFVGSLVWFALSLSGRPLFPSRAWIIETLFLLFGGILVLTRHQTAPGFWEPVLNVTQRSAQIARWLILTTAANLLLCLVALVVYRSVGRPVDSSKALAALSSSIALLGSAYIGTHWAYRPENLFSQQVRRIAGNPLLYLMSPSYRRNSRKDVRAR